MLTVILLTLAQLQDNPQIPQDSQARLRELEHEAQRAARLTRQLLVFSRRQKLDVKPLELRTVIDNLASMLRRLIGEDIALEFQDQSYGAWVNADEGMMEQIVTNLCINARDAMPKGGRLTVGLQQVTLDAASLKFHPKRRTGTFVCLQVADTGCGMDDQTIKRVFEHFFTTKEPGKGTGLGLPTVCAIIKQHGGWIEVESTLGMGSTFRVYIPAWERSSTSVDASQVLTNLPRGTETILLVEDESHVREASALCLRKLGYAVFEAANGAEALSQFNKHQPRIHLVVTDMIMPGGMTGLDLAERLLKQDNALRTIITSGHDEELTRPELFGERGAAYLHKPYDEMSLARIVRECLDKSTVAPTDSGQQDASSHL